MGSGDGSGLETQIWDTLAFRQDGEFPRVVGEGVAVVKKETKDLKSGLSPKCQALCQG